jgi:Uma2 family endonuclease
MPLAITRIKDFDWSVRLLREEGVMSTTTSAPAWVGPECDGRRMTSGEFDAIEEWDPEFRYELIHGVVVVNPIPLESEADPNGELEYLLRSNAKHHPEGRALDATMAERYVHLPDGSRRRADRVIWAGLGRLPQPQLDVPTIVVELASRRIRDRRRDLVEKRAEYAAAGVREYWVIDRFRRNMTVYAADAEQVVSETETYATPLLPGFELPLARLFAIADRWNQPRS